MSPKDAVTFRDLSFHWPDGTIALAGLDGTLPSARTGLVGRNGAGKSTLLRLIHGQLTPTSGRIDTCGEVGYLPQNLTIDPTTTVADLLGVSVPLAALRAIEAGDADPRHFDDLGDNWDVEARAAEALDRVGLGANDLSRRAATLSGGEATLVALTGIRLRGTPITLLDEPTNNLDRGARAQLHSLIDAWRGTLVVVSHDRELLEHMDVTAELHGSRLTTFGGPYSAWSAHLAEQQAAAEQASRAARQTLKAEKRQRTETETKLARRERTANTAQRDGGLARIVAGGLASSAGASAGALRSVMNARVQAAQDALDAADARVRDDDHIRLELPDPALPHGRALAELHDGIRTLEIRGPERVALVGGNGVGKSTLLAQLVSGKPAGRLRAHGTLLTDRVGYLPQRLDVVDDTASALHAVQAVAPGVASGDIRNRLARLLVRGDMVDRPVGSLSGGERFRVVLATLLFADPPAQLLILDEPTNNLDMASVDQLVEALSGYRGAVLVVTHDHDFAGRLQLTRVIELDAEGRLHERSELPS